MNPIDLPDVQSSPSTSNFKLTRVGVTGVKKLVQIKRPDKKTSNVPCSKNGSFC